MFTSRAEFRLHLRIDNADRRLTPHGRRLGLINDEAWADYEAKQARAVALEKLLATRKVNPEKLAPLLPEATALGSLQGQTYAQILKRPEVTIETLYPLIREELRTLDDAALFTEWIENPEGAKRERLDGQPRNELKSVETEIKYSGYLDQQKKSIEKLKKAEQRTIPEWFDYKAVSGLSREMQEKLTRVRPATIGQASRIPGVTPAALTLVNVYIEIQAACRTK
jgi:tRNA uridine 5-carboxymethylaminomethyl modification enzyme